MKDTDQTRGTPPNIPIVQLLNTKQVAMILHSSVANVRRLVKLGQMRGFYMGAKLLIDRNDLAIFLESRKDAYPHDRVARSGHRRGTQDIKFFRKESLNRP